MKPKLACNMSPPLIQLLQQDRVSLDYLCLTRLDVLDEELELALRFKPALLHVFERAGRFSDLAESYDWDHINHAVERAGTPHVGIHLQLNAEDWPEPMDLRHQDRDQSRDMIARLMRNFSSAKDKARCPVLFENLPYSGFRGTARITVEPALMWQLVSEGIGMLLDSSHLRCTAYHLGVDACALASSWPLSAVREIHVSGPTEVEGQGLTDSHASMAEEDYAILEWLLERTDAEVVTLEYGGTDPTFEMLEDDVSGELVKQLEALADILS